jgi:hypothetical protein
MVRGARGYFREGTRRPCLRLGFEEYNSYARGQEIKY